MFSSNAKLQIYCALFALGSEKAGLDHLSSRFDWLRGQLVKYNDHYERIFPSHWNVRGFLCLRFCEQTSKHLDEILRSESQTGNIDIGVLVKALEQCVLFEKELERLYSQPIHADVLKERAELDKLLGETDENELESKDAKEMTAEDITTKYKLRRVKQRITDLENKHAEESRHKSAEQLAREVIEPVKLAGVLSSCFEKYMHYYIKLEAKNIQQTLDEIEKSE
ncbi:hypothetical protein RFI_11506, partial [Reticulomyxa filosa]